MEGFTVLLVAALVATVLAVDPRPQSPNTVITIGGSCNSDNECAIKNAYCNSIKKCDCVQGFKPFNDSNASGLVKSVCAKALGENCDIDGVCFPTAKCISGECNCDGNQGYVPSRDSSRCLHKSNGYNSSCSTTVECPEWGDGTICSSNRCICQPEYHFYESKCYYSIEFGQSCTPDDTKKRCYLPADGNNQHVTCNENKKMCECAKGYVPSDDQQKCNSAAASVLSLGCLLMAFFSKMTL